jgi:hypothetical protein
VPPGANAAATRASMNKSFCFFFQKEALSCQPPVSINTDW